MFQCVVTHIWWWWWWCLWCRFWWRWWWPCLCWGRMSGREDEWCLASCEEIKTMWATNDPSCLFWGLRSSPSKFWFRHLFRIFTKLINHESFQHYFDTTVDYKHPNHLLFTRMTNILNHRQDDLKPPPPSLQVSTCLQCLSPFKSYFVLSNNFSAFWDFFGTQNLKFLCRSTQWCILRSNFELKLIHEFEILPNCLKCLISKKQNHLHRSVGFLVSTK